jgi:hypothetical protein
MVVSKTFIFFLQALMAFAILWFCYWLIYTTINYIRHKLYRQAFTPVKFGNSFIYSAAFSCLGYTLGLLVGFTTSPIAQFIIPALLTFLGGFVTILLSKEKATQTSDRTVAAALLVIPFFLVFGLEIGAAERDKATRITKLKELHYLELELKLRKLYK